MHDTIPRFGRFLNFLTMVRNPESIPNNLTERRFRSFWECVRTGRQRSDCGKFRS